MTRGYVGVEAQQVDADHGQGDASAGELPARCWPACSPIRPAAQAGLQPGDVIQR